MTTWKHKLAAAAIAASAITGATLAATPAIASPAVPSSATGSAVASPSVEKIRWLYKTFYDFGACTSYYYSPPAGVTVDFWYGCKLTAPGVFTVRYHR